MKNMQIRQNGTYYEGNLPKTDYDNLAFNIKDLSKFYPVFQDSLGDYIRYDMLNEKPVFLLLFHDEVNADYDFWDLVDVWLNMKFEL